MDEDQTLLRARIDNLERLADRLAHELATPLTTAHGFASLLLDRPDLPPDVRDGIQRIERAAGSALSILRSRVDEGLGEEPRTVRLRAVVRDAVTSVVGDTSPAGRDLDPELRVFGDPAAMRAAVALCVSGIVEHARLSGADPDSLEVELVKERTTAHQLRIAATGPPVSSERRDGILAGDSATDDPVVTALRRARSLLGRLGGRIWLDEARLVGIHGVLVELPRDAAD